MTTLKRACRTCGGVSEGHLTDCPKYQSQALNPPEPAHAAFAGTLPKRAGRADVHSIVEDIYEIASREVAAFKLKPGLRLEELRGLAELARTLKEVRALEALVEEELGDELAKSTDEELEARAHGAVVKR